MALSVWSLVVWTTRIGNIWRDEELTVAGQVGRTALAGSFTAFALGALFGVVARRSSARWFDRGVVAFALWTIGVWVVRVVGIAGNGHGVAFVVVHAVLAVVSIGLAGLTFARRDGAR